MAGPRPVEEGDEFLKLVDGDVGDGPVIDVGICCGFLLVVVVGLVGEDSYEFLDALEAGDGGLLGRNLFRVGPEAAVSVAISH